MSRCKELFVQAAELPVGDRAGFLARECAADETLRSEVERLLSALERAGDFLEVPAVDRSQIPTPRPLYRPGVRVGPYVLSEQVGEGGMGVVWRAEQTAPVQRDVALKLLKSGAESRHVLARFEAERRALERMDHPNVARVLDAGLTDGGRPFVVMELVRGAAITTFCDVRRLNIAERLRLFVPVCRAVQHAHAKGIIHRDLKPSNILVTDDDAAPIPKVIDFGIARPVERTADETNHTRGLLLLGTPAYISPEQALMGSDVDTRADVYSLGAVLYELLCGCPPFDPRELAKLPADELLHRLRHDDPPRPSRRLASWDEAPIAADARGTTEAALRRLLEGDLDRIVMKALAKDPAERYETAAAMADDVGRFLRHEPVSATRPSALYHGLKFAARHQTGIIASALVAVSLLVGTATSTWLALRAVRAEAATSEALRMERSARLLATYQERHATANEARFHRQAYISDMNLADEAYRIGDARRMKELLELHIPEPGETDLRAFEWHFLWKQCTAPGRVIDQFDGAIYDSCLNPDRSLIAACGADGTIRLYDTKNFAKVGTIASGQIEVNGVAFSPDGTRIASAGDDGTVKLWDVATHAELNSVDVFKGKAFQVQFVDTADELLLAVCGEDPVIKLFDGLSVEPRGELRGHTQSVEAIANGDRGRLASASKDGVPTVWDVASRSVFAQADRVNSALTTVAFSPNGRFVGWGTSSAACLVWDLKEDKPQIYTVVDNHREGEAVTSLSFAAGSSVVVVGDRGGVIRAIRRTRGGAGEVPKLVSQWIGDPVRAYCVSSIDGGRHVVTGGSDGALRIWSPQPTPERSVIAGRSKRPKDFDVSREGDIVLASAGGLEIWNVNGKSLGQLPGADHDYCVVDVSDDGSVVVAGNETGRVTAWIASDGGYVERWTKQFEGDPAIYNVELTNNGRFAAVLVSPITPDPKELHLLEITDGATSRSIVVPGAFGLATDHTGSRIAVDREGTVLLLSTPSLAIERRLSGHGRSVPAIAFSPREPLIATGGKDRRIVLWDSHTGEPVRDWVAHVGELKTAAFSPDGERLLTTGTEGTPKLWDVRTGRLLFRFPRLVPQHWPLRFTSDNRAILAIRPTGGLLVFDGSPSDVPSSH